VTEKIAPSGGSQPRTGHGRVFICKGSALRERRALASTAGKKWQYRMFDFCSDRLRGFTVNTGAYSHDCRTSGCYFFNVPGPRCQGEVREARPTDADVPRRTPIFSQAIRLRD